MSNPKQDTLQTQAGCAPVEPRKKGPLEIIKVGTVSIRIYRVAAKNTLDGFAYRFREGSGPGEVHGNSVDLGEIRIKAKRAAKQMSEGITTHVKASDMNELIAVRRLAEEHAVPPVAAMQEWSAAKTLTGPALLSVAKEHADTVADGTHERATHAEVWRRFIAAKDKAGRKGTRTYGSKSGMIMRGLGAEVMFDTLNTAKIQAWADTIEDPVTCNDLLKRLGTLFRWCRKKGLFPRGRAIPTDDVDRAHVPEKLPGILSPSQTKACLEFIRRNHIQYLAAISLSALGSMRADEVHGKRSDKGTPRSTMPRQRWAHVHIKPENRAGTCGYFSVSVAKKRTPSYRKTPIQPVLAAWLALCPRDGEYVCIAGAMERVRELLRAAKDELGFEVPENAFRHSYITYRLPFVGIVQTAAEAGNSPSEIERSYRVPMDIEEARPYWQIMPDPPAPSE